jgi:hypothetical protein
LHKERFHFSRTTISRADWARPAELLGRATQIAEAGLGDGGGTLSMIEVHPREQYCSEMRGAEDQKWMRAGHPDRAGSQF